MPRSPILVLLIAVSATLQLCQAAVIGEEYTQAPPQNYENDEVTVSTKLGQLKGQVLVSRGGQKYYAFYGVPYAKKPERFEIAKPIEPWTGVKNAGKNFSTMCPQSSQLGVEDAPVVGDEDCLHLNVFYPDPARCKNSYENGGGGVGGGDVEKLPVIFFIHPGAFVGGSGQFFEPKYLMDKCIVFVSPNFRLGALGFLTTDDGLIQGNLGHKDLLLALKWTRDHIDDFRGDKYSVTLTGTSSGANSVGHFITSPAAKGLFQRAIAQSGSAIVSLISRPGEKAAMLAGFLNCSTKSTMEMKECLKSKDFKEIIGVQDKGKQWTTDALSFGPVVELAVSKFDQNYEAFQTKDPMKLLESGDFNRVPLITGFTEEEGITVKGGEIINNEKAVKELNQDWHRVAPIVLLYDDLNVTAETRNNISDKIKKFYFGDKMVSNSTFRNLARLLGDVYVNHGVLKTIELHSKYAPVYSYVFTFKGQKSIAEVAYGIKEPVVSHLDDAPYIYRCPMSEILDLVENQERPMEELKKFSNNMIDLLTSFVIEGKPGPTWTEGVHWTEYDPNKEGGILKIDEKMENLFGYLKDRKVFWDHILTLQQGRLADEDD